MIAARFVHALGLFAILGSGPPAQARARAASDQDTLRELNDAYVRAFLTADVEWYDAHLTEDFVCILTNGKPISRADFLAATRRGPGVESYTIDDVTIRVHGNAALVGAVGTWRRADGTRGRTRYIDVYVRRRDGWKVASAQLTKVE